jgi:hypothetical protein
MGTVWRDEAPVLPRNRDTAWGVVYLLIGFAILVLTPPAAMSPWFLAAACVGFAVGVFYIGRGYLADLRERDS